MSEFGLLVESTPVVGFPMLADAEDINWRPVTRYPARFDLPPVTHQRMCQIAQFLYISNPMAHRIIELIASFAVGTGIEFKAKEEAVQHILEKFWFDPVNAWDKKLLSRVRELSLYGEQIYPITINPVDGSIVMGYINPIDVIKVELDPSNTEICRKVCLSMQLSKSTVQPELDVVNYDNNPYSPSFGKLMGQVFFFAINKAIDATRGTSDLLPLADGISMFDQFLFNALERSAHMNAWLWDVELQGKSEPEIVKWLNEMQLKPPKPGSVRAHNEFVKWSAIQPNLSAQDLTEAARMFKLYILGGIGFPEHYFADGSKVNRGSAAEMSEPTFRTIQARQTIIKNMILHIFSFVVDQAEIAGVLPPKIDRSITILMPELSLRDLQRSGGAIYRISQALELAENHGWIDKERASKMFDQVSRQVGL